MIFQTQMEQMLHTQEVLLQQNNINSIDTSIPGDEAGEISKGGATSE